MIAATPRQVEYAIQLRDELLLAGARERTPAWQRAFNAFVYQLSDLLVQNIQGRRDPTWRHYRYVADGTTNRELIEERIRARHREILDLSDEAIMALSKQEISHLIDDYKGGI